MKLYDEHAIDKIPECTQEWKDPLSIGTMFPKWINDRGLSKWEIDYCPWWLDYPHGQWPRGEGDLYHGMAPTFCDHCFLFANIFKVNLCFILFGVEHASEKVMETVEEVASASKRGASSTKTGVSPNKKVVIVEDSVSGSSIKKRLQYIKNETKGGGSKHNKEAKEGASLIGMNFFNQIVVLDEKFL